MIARQDAGGDVDWYVADRLGSVRAVFDNSGTVTNAIVYDAVGGPVFHMKLVPTHHISDGRRQALEARAQANAGT